MDDTNNITDLITMSQSDLESILINETDREKIKNIIDIFNLSIKKKDVIRNVKLAELQDKIYSQMEKRVTSQPDMFSNQDLLKYYETIQQTLNKSIGKDEEAEIPKIQINQQSIHLEDKAKITRESRIKILDIVNSILEDADQLNMNDFVSEEIEDGN